MSKNNSQTVYMTSPARVGRMLAIMLGVCLIGGIVFFSMWDYWISQPPPVVALMAGEKTHTGPAEATGITITQDLQFIESADFRTLAFNALPGEEGHNPDVAVNSGDEVTITTNNVGMSFHAFGVVSNPDDFNSVVFDSAIAAATNPLKPGESGSTTFTAGAPGTYYYICTCLLYTSPSPRD